MNVVVVCKFCEKSLTWAWLGSNLRSTCKRFDMSVTAGTNGHVFVLHGLGMLQPMFSWC